MEYKKINKDKYISGLDYIKYNLNMNILKNSCRKS